MCGILGKVTFSGEHESPRQFAYALEQIAHRGPDDHGTRHDGNSGQYQMSLGHTRLSILDLTSAGHQPMTSPTTGTTIVYNGEVYNFREIRQWLQTKGHAFRSECDTEVILAAYDELQDAFLRRLIGMFALAVWDRKGQRLLLARDRLGIKPLYYYWDGRQFAFASELTALVALPSLNLGISSDAIHHLLLYGYIPDELSIFDNVKKLLPGNQIILDLERRELNREQYWDSLAYYDPPLKFSDEQEVLDAIREELERSVRRRLISDVPIGAFLSGGIDSSLVTAVMQDCSSVPVKTFTIGFSEASFDEAPAARGIAEYIGSDHKELYIDQDNVLELVRTTADYYDEPFADTSSVPTLALSRMTREHVTVALSGDGGDELFWGYDKYSPRGYAQYERFKGVPLWLRRKIGGAMERLRESPIGPLGYQLKFDDFVEYYLRKYFLRLHYFYPGLCRHPGQDSDRVVATNRKVIARLGPSDRNKLMGAMDLHNYLPDDILTKVDRASMSVGLEARVPLLDHNVVQLAAGIPTEFRSGSGELKRLLKKLLGQYVPAELWDRPKQGFDVPIGIWLRTSLKSWAIDELRSSSSSLSEWVDMNELDRVVEDHLAAKRNNTDLIWACLQFIGWERRARRIRADAPRAQ